MNHTEERSSPRLKRLRLDVLQKIRYWKRVHAKARDRAVRERTRAEITRLEQLRTFLDAHLDE